MTERRVLLGRIGSPFGIQGNVKVVSWTDPPAAIFSYQPWIISSPSGKELVHAAEQGRGHGTHFVASLSGITDRDQASALRGSQIFVVRSVLPSLDPDIYYWVDLEGLRVETLSGQPLGRVDHIFSTGVNDVLVVKGERERMIPLLIPDIVQSVDRRRELIQVDWDPSF